MEDFAVVGTTQPAKKGGKGAVILAIVFALIAVGLGVWVVILLTNNNGGEAKREAASDNTDTVVVDNDAKIRELVKDVYGAVPATYDGYTAVKSFDSGVEISIADGVIMRTDRSYGIDSELTDINGSHEELSAKSRSVIDAAVLPILSKYGLKKTSEPKGYFAWGNEHYAFYEGNSIVCYYGTGIGFAFECADKNWYSEDDKSLTLALADAYKKKEGKAIGYLGAKTKGITKNKAGTYELITASEDDAVALFYRKVGDGDWKFFTALQQGPWCDSFNTAELKEAYEGEECLSVNGDMAVVKK